MKIDFEELELVLLKFSKYRICDEELKAIKCSETIAKLKDIRETNENKKFITVFIILNNKLVHKEEKRLDNFSLEFFSKYSKNKDKKGFRVIAYCFDITTKSEKEEYIDFLATNNKKNFIQENKNNAETIKTIILPIVTLFSAFTIFFTYVGFSEYGIPASYIADIATISFLIISIIFFASTVITSLYIFISLPILALLFVFYEKYNPLNFSILSNKFIKGFKILFLIVGGGIIFVFTLLMSESLLSSLTKHNTTFSKSAYELAISEYFYHYSGYPKILKKNGKYYYLPIKDTKYYYVYDIENVRKLYFKTITKDSATFNLLCDDKENILKDTRAEFKKHYLLYNNFIQPIHLNLQFPISKGEDYNITDMNNSRLITENHIINLCNK